MMRVLIIYAALAAPALAGGVGELPPVPDGKARVVVFRINSFSGWASFARIALGATRLGSLGSGDAQAFDVAPGNGELGATSALGPDDDTKGALSLKAGETRFILVSVQERYGPKREHPIQIGNATCGVSWCLQEVGRIEAGILLKGKSVDPPKS